MLITATRPMLLAVDVMSCTPWTVVHVVIARRVSASRPTQPLEQDACQLAAPARRPRYIGSVTGVQGVEKYASGLSRRYRRGETTRTSKRLDEDVEARADADAC